jgi:hypothetical protein
MGRRDRARPDHLGALTSFCSARRRPIGDREIGKAGTKDPLDPPITRIPSTVILRPPLM